MLSLFVVAGCAGTAPSSVSPPPAPARAETAPPARALPPPNERERALAVELRSAVTELGSRIGERNAEKKWELASAADFVATSLEDLGYAVAREGYEVGDIVAQNLEVTVPGGERGEEAIVVGAHYDSALRSPGAGDNASGVAAVLALARALRDSRPGRSLHFVCFANREAPFAGTPDMGSLRYAKGLAARGARVIAMLNLDSIGRFSDTPGSQREVAVFDGEPPTVGDFIAVVSRRADERLAASVLATLLARGSVPARRVALGDPASASDEGSFWQMGWPAVRITDTGAARSAAHHTPGEVLETLDFDRMARVVAGVEAVIVELAGGARAEP